MRCTTWFAEYQTLKAIGVAPLTDSERGLRRLPIEDVHTCEALFQPRQMIDDADGSGQHLDELKRVLKDQGYLDPITVMKIGGKWFCIDGHHRLEAYRQAGGRKTHIPIKVFSGTVEEALRVSIEVNAPDKLNLTKEDKLEAAWRLVVLGQDSVSQISTTSTIAERSVQRMRRGLEKVRTLHPSQSFETWTWAEVKRLLQGHPKEMQTGWHEAKVREWEQLLIRTFGGLPSQHPLLFAQALNRSNKAVVDAIISEHQRAACGAGDCPDF